MKSNVAKKTHYRIKKTKKMQEKYFFLCGAGIASGNRRPAGLAGIARGGL
jgi:hypothetical protein